MSDLAARSHRQQVEDMRRAELFASPMYSQRDVSRLIEVRVERIRRLLDKPPPYTFGELVRAHEELGGTGEVELDECGRPDAYLPYSFPPRLVRSTPHIRSGSLCVSGTRMPVEIIYWKWRQRMDADAPSNAEIAEQHGLLEEQVKWSALHWRYRGHRGRPRVGRWPPRPRARFSPFWDSDIWD